MAEPQRCRDVMTPDPASCTESDNVIRAAELMKNENVGPIPVVDSGSRRLTGIVTDRDLVLKVLAEGHNPRRTRVSEVMTRDPVTCKPDDPVDRAIDLMALHQIRRIPVVDGGRLVGIIAQADVATRISSPVQTGTMVREISEAPAQH